MYNKTISINSKLREPISDALIYDTLYDNTAWSHLSGLINGHIGNNIRTLIITELNNG